MSRGSTSYAASLPSPRRVRRRSCPSPTPLVYRLRLSSERGTTWLDEDGVVWLCAVRRRVEGSDDDAFRWFADLHKSGRLLPTDDDRLRDKAEEARLLFGYLKGDLIELVDGAGADPGVERETDLGGWLPSRVIAFEEGGVGEIWCGVCVRSADGNFFGPRPGTFSSLLWRAIWPRSSLRPGATGRRAMSGGSRRSGWGCGSRVVIACYSLDGLHGHVEEMGGDGGVTRGEDGAGAV